ncbi:hypothetical protein ABK040_013405 [Willaertia magna]
MKYYAPILLLCLIVVLTVLSATTLAKETTTASRSTSKNTSELHHVNRFIKELESRLLKELKLFEKTTTETSVTYTELMKQVKITKEKYLEELKKLKILKETFETLKEEKQQEHEGLIKIKKEYQEQEKIILKYKRELKLLNNKVIQQNFIVKRHEKLFNETKVKVIKKLKFIKQLKLILLKEEKEQEIYNKKQFKTFRFTTKNKETAKLMNQLQNKIIQQVKNVSQLRKQFINNLIENKKNNLKLKYNALVDQQDNLLKLMKELEILNGNIEKKEIKNRIANEIKYVRKQVKIVRTISKAKLNFVLNTL